jgi:hypothetical protein
MLLFRPFGSGGSGVMLCVDIKRLLVHGEVRNREYHEDGIRGLATEDPSLRHVEELAWCSGIRNSGMKVAAAARVTFRVLPFRVKPKAWP